MCSWGYLAFENHGMYLSRWILHWRQWRVYSRYGWAMATYIYIWKNAKNNVFTVTAVSQCRIHPDCRTTEQCHTGTCLDACRVEQCGTNAICTSRDHSIICTCPPNYTGDARIACYPSEYHLPTYLYPTVSQIRKKIPFWFWLFSLLPYKKCNLAAASHAPRRLAGMKIRKIILSYCAQWCSSS